MPDIILSIKPRYVDAILSGTKTFEYRRVRPNIKAGDHIIIYASSPISSIVGSFSITQMLTASPQELWRKSHGQAGLSKKDFEAYFEGVMEGVALEVDSYSRLENPLSLAMLREIYDGFHPPQSFRYVDTLPDNGQKLWARLKASLSDEY